MRLSRSLLRLGAVTALAWAASEALRLRPHSPPCRLYEYDWNGYPLRYARFGVPGKPPAVLVHDLRPSCSSDDWLALAERLSGDRLVYLPNLPGFGYSPPYPGRLDRALLDSALSDFLLEVCGEAHLVTSGLSAALGTGAPCRSRLALNPIARVRARPLRALMVSVPLYSDVFWALHTGLPTFTRHAAAARAQGRFGGAGPSRLGEESLQWETESLPEPAAFLELWSGLDRKA